MTRSFAAVCATFAFTVPARAAAVAGNRVVRGVTYWVVVGIGALLLVLAVLDECVCVLRGGTPSYVARVQERHARGDFSEEL